jgi:hypothetical protein
MINLKAMYGDKLFEVKKAYRNTQFIPIATGFMIDIFVAWVIVSVFDISWDLAVVKVFLILLLFGILKHIFSRLIGLLNFKLVLKKAMASEMRHYLKVFNKNVFWDRIATYDDFLLGAAYNITLDPEMRVLAGMLYGAKAAEMSITPSLENRYYEVFCEVYPEFMESS